MAAAVLWAIIDVITARRTNYPPPKTPTHFSFYESSSPSQTYSAGPVMYTGFPSPSHPISTEPPSRTTRTRLSARPERTAVTATAHDPEPLARVSPAPRSQTLILTSRSFRG